MLVTTSSVSTTAIGEPMEGSRRMEASLWCKDRQTKVMALVLRKEKREKFLVPMPIMWLYSQIEMIEESTLYSNMNSEISLDKLDGADI